MTALTLAPLSLRKPSGTPFYNMSWRRLSKLPTRLSRWKTGELETINGTATPTTGPSFSLADLPVELVRGIVSYLDYESVTSLRLVCRDFDQLVSSSDSEVMRHLALHQLHHIPRPLIQPTSSEIEWQHVLRQTRRWEMAEAVSAELMRYSQYKIPLHHNVQRVLRYPPQAKNIQEKMTPLLFTLSDYLSSCRARLMCLASEDDQSVECQAHLDAYTVAMLETSSLSDVRSLHGMWLFLLGVLNFVLARPSYAGAVERTIRGWTAEPLDRCSLARILVFGGFPAVLRILSLGDYTERKKWVRQYLASLDPARNPKWADKRAKFDVGLDPLPSESQAKKAIRMDIHMHCLWTQGAKIVLGRAGGEYSLAEQELKPSNENTINLLSNLARRNMITTTVSAIAAQSTPNWADGDDSRSRSSSFEVGE